MIKVQFKHDNSSFKVQTDKIDAANLESMLKRSSNSANYLALNIKLTSLDVSYISTDNNGYDKIETIYAKAKNRANLAQELAATLVGKEILVCWNKSIAFKNGDTTVYRAEYSSHVPFATFCESIIQDESFLKLGVGLFDCFEKDSLRPFSLDLVASNLNPLTVQAPKKQAAYCYSTMPQMLLSIELDERVIERVKADRKRSAEGESGGDPKRRFLSAFAALGQQDLDTAIAEGQPGDTPEWDAAIVACRKQLEMVSMCIRPVPEHNEAARRLVIDQVMLAVTHHLHVQFCVEEPQNHANPAAPNTGWGKLDYAVDSKPVVVEVCREAVPLPHTVSSATAATPQLSEESGEKEDNQDDVGDEVGEAQDPVETMLEAMEDSHPAAIQAVQQMLAQFRALEAKKENDDNAIAQLLSQMYDKLLAADQSTQTVLGILSNGHDWHLLSLARASTPGNLPQAAYHGRVDMKVLRQPASTPVIQRRPSCRSENNWHVELQSVERVMRAVRYMLTTI